MNIKTHSPQPWRRDGHRHILDANDNIVAGAHFVGHEPGDANANLIAAAPAMYDLICEMYDFAAQIDDEDSRMPADLMDTARQIFKSMEAAK